MATIDSTLNVFTHNFSSINEMFNTSGYPIIAGPCSVESYDQMDIVADYLVSNGLEFIRAGAYKPRSSPYDFQGLGEYGLKILDRIRKKYGLLIVTEILDTIDIELGIQYSDIIQIGSRNMFNTALLKKIGRTNHPVLLKRGMMATLSEFMLSAEYILNEGNDNIIVCERGIRSFENSVRNVIDISSIAIIKKFSTIPIIVDLSHSLGRKDIIAEVAKGVMAIGSDGLMVEMHPSPSKALSDPGQQLDPLEFEAFLCSIGRNV